MPPSSLGMITPPSVSSAPPPGLSLPHPIKAVKDPIPSVRSNRNRPIMKLLGATVVVERVLGLRQKLDLIEVGRVAGVVIVKVDASDACAAAAEVRASLLQNAVPVPVERAQLPIDVAKLEVVPSVGRVGPSERRRP